MALGDYTASWNNGLAAEMKVLSNNIAIPGSSDFISLKEMVIYIRIMLFIDIDSSCP